MRLTFEGRRNRMQKHAVDWFEIAAIDSEGNRMALHSRN
jgi:hypothetical protein